jgi:DNA mismatch repair protein MutS2
MDSLRLLDSSARVLEFDALRELLRGYSSSTLGRQRIDGLAPSTHRNWIDEQQGLAEEVREFRRAGGRFDFSGLLEIAKLIDKARIAGAALETAEIRDVVLVVDRAAEWREIALHPPASMKSEWCRVRVLSERVTDFTEFLRFFRNKIQPDGTLEDRASPELARVRREIEKQRRAIQESLRGYLRRLAEDGAVQDELITIRGERFVIPVKTEQKRRVQGVVHGASSSGQTVFVEPLETIEQNNELVRLLDEELAEIHRILLEMTRRIGELAEAIGCQGALCGRLQMRRSNAQRRECVAARRPACSRECPASIVGAESQAQRGERRCGECGTRRRTAAVGDHWPQHWRKDGHPQNRWTAGVDVTVGHSGSS